VVCTVEIGEGKEKKWVMVCANLMAAIKKDVGANSCFLWYFSIRQVYSVSPFKEFL
jgi:hypothetical protein